MRMQPIAKLLLTLLRKVQAPHLVILMIFLGLSSSAFAARLGHSMSEKYLIGPEDVLHISVWKEEELDREVVVRPDGKISFPLIGNIHVAGRTTEEVQRDITERLKKYIPEPVATVSVKMVSGYKIYVLGKVNNPGEFTIGRYIDVLQALTLAGGLNPYASKNGIKILRRENGQQKALPFEYGEVEDGEDLDQNIILRSGDVVVVP
ncbi:polysaccharide export protein [Nitrosococcus wardiae]|uniref:Polysaccharide export protein n=2 Tax=Nitrosococcus wardiae TaxID=1814290 RepID=A0A4P7BWD4_9GAMM|nr:polysaccharide export protein [Nitrosococcus wardiae]